MTKTIIQKIIKEIEQDKFYSAVGLEKHCEKVCGKYLERTRLRIKPKLLKDLKLAKSNKNTLGMPNNSFGAQACGTGQFPDIVCCINNKIQIIECKSFKNYFKHYGNTPPSQRPFIHYAMSSKKYGKTRVVESLENYFNKANTKMSFRPQFGMASKASTKLNHDIFKSK